MFECHITIDPVIDPYKLKRLDELVSLCDFRIAKLYKHKGERATNDCFISGCNVHLTALRAQANILISYLRNENYGLRRCKFEEIIEDKRW